MYLIDQHTKAIMEKCKEKARSVGLTFTPETLEYIVTNQDLLELSPKIMIPTLYDYWVHDVEVLKEYAKYKLYPTNPYETVINSRPAISYYNDNNPDWLNVMIFYHVLGHIDFFQNNQYFRHTWDDDFVGAALADKRLINSLRSRYGRWVDYVIEFSRSIDNIVAAYNYDVLLDKEIQDRALPAEIDYYFNVFLPEVLKASDLEIFKQLEKYNFLVQHQQDVGQVTFFSQVRETHPEFESYFNNYVQKQKSRDLLEFIRDNSPFLKQESNQWMKSVMNIIRNTALYFAPQIRTKIMNEGWASYWHDHLFREDPYLQTHEVDYAKINAYVTSLSRVGLNPYAIGLRLFEFVEELADKGKFSSQYQQLALAVEREQFNLNTGKGKEAIFNVRRYFNDFMFIHTFVTQEFVDRHHLFVVGKRINEEEGVIEYYIKSRKAEDYKKMLIDNLYHPPVIYPDMNKTNDKVLYLVHEFEGKQLIQEFIPEVLIGLNYLWGGEVQLETTEILVKKSKESKEEEEVGFVYRPVLYVCKDRKVEKRVL